MLIETTILQFLKSKLTVPVGLGKPEPMPLSFVLLEKTAGTEAKGLKASTFAFQSYAPTHYEASELNDKVKQAVSALIELDDIASVELNSNYNFPDTEAKRHRYQAVYDLTHY